MHPVASCPERGLASYEWSTFVLNPDVESRHHILSHSSSAGRSSEIFFDNYTVLELSNMGEGVQINSDCKLNNICMVQTPPEMGMKKCCNSVISSTKITVMVASLSSQIGTM